MVKEKIQNRAENTTKEKQKNMNKLRHQKQQKFERQKYLKETGIKEVERILRVRLAMLDIVDLARFQIL